MVSTFVQQRRVDRRRRLVDKTRRVQRVKHRLTFTDIQSPRLSSLGASFGWQHRSAAVPIQGRPADAHRPTGRGRAHFRNKRFGGFHQSTSFSPGVFGGILNISETFF